MCVQSQGLQLVWMAQVECVSRVKHKCKWYQAVCRIPRGHFPLVFLLSASLYLVVPLIWPCALLKEHVYVFFVFFYGFHVSHCHTSCLNLYVQLSHSHSHSVSHTHAHRHLYSTHTHTHTHTHIQVRVFEWENPQAGSYPGSSAVWAQLSQSRLPLKWIQTVGCWRSCVLLWLRRKLRETSMGWGLTWSCKHTHIHTHTHTHAYCKYRLAELQGWRRTEKKLPNRGG